jgi:hypothetical protein
VRAANGAIATFDVPAAGTAAGQGTVGEGINSAGVVVGNYIDGDGLNHGFLWPAGPPWFW